jgi:hypothetical protein
MALDLIDPDAIRTVYELIIHTIDFIINHNFEIYYIYVVALLYG